jgi:hypothetical protein
VPPTTTTTTATTTTAGVTTTSTAPGDRSLSLQGSSANLGTNCTRSFQARILVDGQAVDEEGTLVTFAQVGGGGDSSFSNGNSSATVDGVATIQVTGTKNGEVVLQAFTGGGLASNQLSFDVSPDGACDSAAVVVPPAPGPGVFSSGPDPLAALATLLSALLGVAVVSARRSMQRLA